MANILLIYGSAYGHTERIAYRVAEILTQAGQTVAMWKGDRLPRDLSLQQYGAYIIAAPVYFGKHQRHIRNFVRRHAGTLNSAPSAFLSVCGAGASPRPEEQAQAQAYVDQFLRSTGWRPTVAKWLAGEVAYRKYNPLLRYVMKRISRQIGRPTDTSRNYDLTDWAAVDAFARELATVLDGSARAPSG